MRASDWLCGRYNGAPPLRLTKRCIKASLTTTELFVRRRQAGRLRSETAELAGCALRQPNCADQHCALAAQKREQAYANAYTHTHRQNKGIVRILRYRQNKGIVRILRLGALIRKVSVFRVWNEVK